MLVIVRVLVAFVGLLTTAEACVMALHGQVGTPAFWGATLVAAAALALNLLLDRLLVTQHAEALELARRGQPLQVSACPWHGTFWLLATAVFIAMAVLAVSHGLGRHTALALCMAVVALGAVLALAHLLWQILQPGPMLRLDRHGLVHALCGRIPWSAVEGIDLRTIHIPRAPSQHHLYLRLRQPRRYLERLPWLARQLHYRELAADRHAGNLRIALNPLSVPAQTIVEAAQLLCLQAPDNRLLPDWQYTMSGIEVVALREKRAAAQVPESNHDQNTATLDTTPARLAALRQRLREQRLTQAATTAEQRRQRAMRAFLLMAPALFLLYLLRMLLR